jgi:hypothetical protein
MAEGYLIQEALGYLNHMDFVVNLEVQKGVKFKATQAEYEEVRLEGVGKAVILEHVDLMAMHHYILENEDSAKPWYK